MNRQVHGRTDLGALGFFVVPAALFAVSCGSPVMRLPSGPGAPAQDVAEVVAEATSACRTVGSIVAEVGVSGSVGGRRLRARLIVGLEKPASARVEAFSLGQQIFILVAREADATLLLTRENRVLRNGLPADILEAVAGVPMSASELRTTLLGCNPETADPSAVEAPGASASGRRIGDDWRIVADGANEQYFQRQAPNGRWRLVALISGGSARPAWRTEFRDFEGDLPRTVRLVSSDSRRFDLRLALSQVELNTPLPAAAFDVKISPSTEPMTIEELRRSGPLSGG
jgi:hypothetical protein